MEYLWLYMLVGALAGVLAGMLGIGGGLVIVPPLAYALAHQGVPPEHVQHLVLGTSLASIVVTSVASLRAHHQQGNVQWPLVRQISPGVVIGTFAGSLVAAALSATVLKWFYAVFAMVVGTQMLLDAKPKASRQLPGVLGVNAVGGVIGVVSSFVGIGGGSLSVPFMLFCNLPVRVAIGTSAAIGLPIAVAGSIGYVLGGWQQPGLPAGSLGYVYVPALVGIALMSSLTAKLGVRLAQRLPVALLKKIFGALLWLIAIRLIAGLWHG
jgi:uncharacterized membrane protein YfcA